ncbi:hypothetical protein A8B74_11775 [Sulfitobacter geojensis]|nr:hypothetical protein A8B74_11775 [Sulfitobacter geojensis]
MNGYIENIAICFNCAPQPVLLATDRDYNLVQMPFVVWARAITPDATREMATKSIDPQPDGIPADYHASLCKQVFNICRA